MKKKIKMMSLQRKEYFTSIITLVSILIFLINNSTSATNIFDIYKESIFEAPKFCNCGLSIYGQASCALPNTNETNRIVGGSAVEDYKLPWQVLLNLSYPDDFLVCGGALINTQYVLTAAHCFQNSRANLTAEDVQVHLGENDIDNRTSCFIIMQAKEIFIHPDRNAKAYLNDIALVKLESPVEFNDGVKPICLPKYDYPNYNYSAGFIGGWGSTNENETKPSRVMKLAGLMVLNNTDLFCTLGAVYFPYDTDLCAYFPETDICWGDSGGPLMMLLEGKCTVIGIASYGKGCANVWYSGVYTRVSKYLDWIKDNSKDGGCFG